MSVSQRQVPHVSGASFDRWIHSLDATPQDVKASMQAVCGGGDSSTAGMLLRAARGLGLVDASDKATALLADCLSSEPSTRTAAYRRALQIGYPKAPPTRTPRDMALAYFGATRPAQNRALRLYNHLRVRAGQPAAPWPCWSGQELTAPETSSSMHVPLAGGTADGDEAEEVKPLAATDPEHGRPATEGSAGRRAAAAATPGLHRTRSLLSAAPLDTSTREAAYRVADSVEQLLGNGEAAALVLHLMWEEIRGVTPLAR